MERIFSWTVDAILALGLCAFVLWAGFSRLHIDAPNRTGGNRAYRDALSISQGNHRFGIVNYTHTPNGSTYILVPFAKAGWQTKEQLRRVPVVISALSIGIWLLVLLHRSRHLFLKCLLAAVAVFLISQPGIRDWHQCLLAHSYMFSILFIVIALSLTCKKIAIPLCILGFAAGWIEYGWLTVQTVAVLTCRFAYHQFLSDEGKGARRWYLPFLEAGLYAVGGVLAIVAHICQNALFYQSWSRGWRDLLGTAVLRANLDIGKDWNSGYYSYNASIITQKGLDKGRLVTILNLWNHFRRLHFTTGNMILIASGIGLYQTWCFVVKRFPRVSISGVCKLLAIAVLVILSAVTWYIIMPWHACCHFHVIYRHMFVPFILSISLVVCLNAKREPRMTRKGIVLASAAGVAAAFLLVFFWRNPPRKSQPRQVKSKGVSLVRNGDFTDGFSRWSHWQYAKQASNCLSIVRAKGLRGVDSALRIENPEARLIGLAQHVKAVSGAVYRLSGAARSVATENPKIIFGGRLGFFLPPQKEKQIVWMSEYNKWWGKELIFTNQVNGHATVYVHMGYGNVSSTGEFTDIRLEQIL